MSCSAAHHACAIVLTATARCRNCLRADLVSKLPTSGPRGDTSPGEDDRTVSVHKLLPPVYGPQRPCLISLYRRFTPPTVLSLTPLPRSLIHTPPRQVSTANASPTPDVEDNNQDPLHPQYEGSEFPRLVGFLGEEECSLDALLESEREPSVSEQALEQEEAWRLLRCWCVFAEVLSFDPLALCWFTNYLKLRNST